MVRDHGELMTDRTGLDTCTAVFSVPQADWASLPRVNSAHPIFTYITMERRRLKFIDGYAVATCDYAGFDDTGSGGGGYSQPVYELVVGLSEEPIETHPKFVEDIGGTASDPINGSMWEHQGTRVWTWDGADNNPGDNNGWQFKGFLVLNADGSLNDFAKIETYLSTTNMTWRKTWNVRATINSIRNAGKIDSPPGGPPDIDNGGDINWLNMGVTQTRRGSAYQLTQEWRASGRRGWNETVYG